MNLKHHLDGLEEVRENLKRVKGAIATRCLRAGVTKGASIVSKEAKRRVKKGRLRKALGQKVKVYRNTKKVVAIVGARKGFGEIKDGKYHDPVKYAHIEEYGRREVRIKKKTVLSDGKVVYGVKVRSYAGRPFLRPAYDSTQEQAERAVGEVTMQRLEAELAKGAGS